MTLTDVYQLSVILIFVMMSCMEDVYIRIAFAAMGLTAFCLYTTSIV